MRFLLFFLLIMHYIIYFCKLIANINSDVYPNESDKRGIRRTRHKTNMAGRKIRKSFCIVNSYVCNCRQPSLEVLFEIAKILNVSPKELIADK